MFRFSRTFFFILRNGKPIDIDNYKEAFGDMLLEPHPTMRIEVWGEMVAPHHYNLCWALIETDKPRSAETLAAAIQRREERAMGREAEENPLFAEQIRAEGMKRERRRQ